MALTTQQIVDGAKCVDSCIAPGMQLSALIYLFQRIEGSNLTTAQLVEGAKCIDGCIAPGMRQSVMIYLLDRIASGA